MLIVQRRYDGTDRGSAVSCFAECDKNKQDITVNPLRV